MTGPERVEVYVDGAAAPAQVLTAPPFDIALDTAALADGEHSLRVVVRFPDGRSHERRAGIVVHNRPDPLPEVALEGLEDGARVSGVIHATLAARPPAVPARRARMAWVTYPLGLVVLCLALWAVFAFASLWMPAPKTGGAPASTTAASAPAPATASAPASGAAVKAGARQFQVQGCSGCHTIAGTGGTAGPNLTHIGARLSRAQMEATITHGKDGMPAFATIGTADLNALLDYLQSLK